MDPVITLLLCVLATARLTQLVHSDRIMLSVRVAIARKASRTLGIHDRELLAKWTSGARRGHYPALAQEVIRERTGRDPMALYWVMCTWCVSVLAAVGPAAIWVWWRHEPLAQFAVAVLSFSLLTVIVLDAQKLIYGKRVMYSPAPKQEEHADRGIDGDRATP